MIRFNEALYYGSLIKRYKRFFMDVKLESGEEVVAHSPNTGSMMGLLEPGNQVLLTKSSDPKRKTAYSAQAIKVGDGFVGINTHLPNKLVKASLEHESLRFLSGYQKVKGEVAYGPDLRSRIDLMFSEHQGGNAPYYLEIKSVTLKVGDVAMFPDAVSLRAQKHIDDLLFTKKSGLNAGLIFIIQRSDCLFFSPAKHIDERYAHMLEQAHLNGLAIKAICAKVDASGLMLSKEIPVVF